MTHSLTAPERETVILINEDEFAEITTRQRTWVTKLRKNPPPRRSRI
jgi:hypothetical protein